MSVSSIVAGEAYVRILPGSMRLLHRKTVRVQHAADSWSSQIAALLLPDRDGLFLPEYKKEE